MVSLKVATQPDFNRDYLAPLHAKQGLILSSCRAEGGSIDGITCVLPPPPPPSPPSPAPVITRQAAPATNDYKLFIYMHESGNNPGAINASSFACGLGQALPCSKMPCSLSDYACQDAFFTAYAIARYGSWYNAYLFWCGHSWW